jgi:hypothetical protein
MDPLVLVAGALALWWLGRGRDVGQRTDSVQPGRAEHEPPPPVLDLNLDDTPAASVGGSPIVTASPLAYQEPVGWIGALVAHGGACMGRCLEYMKAHGHLAPYLAASKGKENGTPKEYVDLDYSRGALFTNVTAETPAPSFPGLSPVWLGVPGEQADLGDGTLPGDSWEDSTFNVSSFPRPAFELEPTSWPSTLDGYANLARMWHMDSAGIVWRMRPGPTRETIRPAGNVAAWANYIVGTKRGAGRGLGRTALVLSKNLNRPLIVPPYYRTSAARRNEWYRRIVRWFYRCAWFVWAAEQLREHSGPPSPAPQWWADHCAAWGVGVPSIVDMVRKGTMKSVHTKESAATALLFCRAVAAHTPWPGSEAASGAQIVPGNLRSSGDAYFKRHVMDMPDGIGSLDPPVACTWWTEYAIKKWNEQQSSKFNLWTTIIQVEANLCSYGVASAVTSMATTAASTFAGAAVQELVSKVSNVCVQNALLLGMGTPPQDLINYGDVVGILGEAVDVIGAGELAKVVQIPAETWAQVKSAAGGFAKIAGVDNDALAPLLSGVRYRLQALRAQGWDYLDEGFGGLGLAGNARKGAYDSANLIR